MIEVRSNKTKKNKKNSIDCHSEIQFAALDRKLELDRSFDL